jgi:hypothetical protein
MKTQTAKAIVAVVIVLSIFATFPVSLAQDHTVSYQLLDKQGENAAYTLTIVVPENLRQYYQEKSHQLNRLSDFTMFVTPYAMKPIADCLRQIYPDEEDFVNGALMIVHQMEYGETSQGKYPAETLVDNRGDCDVFSYAAASIIKAAGIDVVLLDYEEKNHMNIGVNLSNPPKNARDNAYKITYNSIDYYIAECTGGNWTHGWRAGECPDIAKEAKAQVLTLENAEEIAPGQVSASFKTLETSNLSLEVWPPIAIADSTVTFRGSLSPARPDENVTIYLGVSGHPWTILSNVSTKSDGSYEFTWKNITAGVYAVRASWAGDKTYAGSISGTMSTTVIPVLLVALIVLAIIAIIVSVIAVVASRYKRTDSLALREPEPPSFRGENTHSN